jgi:hypothetical protein
MHQLFFIIHHHVLLTLKFIYSLKKHTLVEVSDKEGALGFIDTGSGFFYEAPNSLFIIFIFG